VAELGDRGRLRRGWAAAWFAGGPCCDRGVSGVHSPAGASPARGVDRAAAHLAHLRARRLPQRAVRQEFRPGQLDPGLRVDSAHLFRRCVLLGESAARLGSQPLLRQPDPLHGERFPLRLPRRLRCGYRSRFRADDGGSSAALRRGGSAEESRCGNPRVRPTPPRDVALATAPTVALVTARAARALDEDMPPLLAAFAAAGANAEIAVWDDPEVDWARFDLA